MALTPSDYARSRGDLDAMRDAAVWSSDGKVHGGADDLLSAGTFGLSRAFHRPSTSAGLVKQFLVAELGKR